VSSLVDKISKFDGLSSLINVINDNKLITVKDIDLIEEVVKKDNPLDLDSVLYGLMFDVIDYNNKYLGLESTNVETEVVSEEIKKEVTWEDILVYLEINLSDISLNLQEEMKKYTNLKSIEETARFIKNSRKVENRIINKLNDVDLIICVLLYSSKKYISNIISYFKCENEVDGRALGKAIEAIPSIFLVNAPDNIPSNYDLFIKNYELLKNEGVNVRNIIINKPIMMISSNCEVLINSIKEVIV